MIRTVMCMVVVRGMVMVIVLSLIRSGEVISGKRRGWLGNDDRKCKVLRLQRLQTEEQPTRAVDSICFGLLQGTMGGATNQIERGQHDNENVRLSSAILDVGSSDSV